MKIQPLGSPSTPRLDERPVTATGTQPAQAGAEAGRAEASANRDDVVAAVKKLNESMQASSQSLEFSVDEDSKEIVVKLIDQSTREVVRQIPSEEALQIAKSIDKMQGLLIRQTA